MHGKLVRDRIPDIISATGRTPNVRVLTHPEIFDALLAKLQEESDELRRAPEDARLEELADILEVVYTLAENVGADAAELNRVANAKRQQRGGFTRGVWLISSSE